MNYSKRWVLIAFIAVISSCSSDDDSTKNQAPNAFNLIEVEDGVANIALTPSFAWKSAIDPDGDMVSYDLFIDTANPPTKLVKDNLAESSYTLENNLDQDTVYYWKVVAKDGHGGKTESAIFKFTTQPQINSEFLLGKWFLISSEGQDPASDCEKTSYMEFNPNGTNYTLLYTDGTDGACIPFIGGEHNFELISESTIRFTHAEDGESFNTEILSINEDVMVLKGFLIPDAIITLIKDLN